MRAAESNAVIMAAGLATRFVPISLEKPKALLAVRGEILVERQIMQLMEAGIENIILVVGYLEEQFQYLKDKFDVTLVYNPYYRTRNNHSSLYAAREYLGDTFICSGDNYFFENVFMEKSSVSYYASVYEQGSTDEWCFTTDSSGRITNITVGGSDAWTMKGHAFLTSDFSEYLKRLLAEAVNDQNSRGKFWEDLYIEHIDEMDMFIKKYKDGVIEEFDSLEELRKFDAGYRDDTGCGILKRIAEQLNCREKELKDFKPLISGEEIYGFSFKMQEKAYQYELKKGLYRDGSFE